MIFYEKKLTGNLNIFLKLLLIQHASEPQNGNSVPNTEDDPSFLAIVYN